VTEIFAWFVGIDWGSVEHAVCLMDGTGRVHGARRVAHTATAIHHAVQGIRDTIAIGLETPHGALVDTLLEAGFAVFAINPKQLARFRDRFTAAGAKDDPRDAQVAADALRTDRRAFRPVRSDAPAVIRLRELCRILEDLQSDETRLANRLREQLYRVNAPWLDLCPAADEAWLWTLLAETPDPAQWAHLPRRRLAPVLRAHRIRRLTVEAILAALRHPSLHVAAGVSDAVATRLAAVLPQLQLVHRQRLEAQRTLDRLLVEMATTAPVEGEPSEHRDVEILLSLPGAGRMVTATMLTEAAGPLALRDYATLRAYGGTAPVSKRSGTRLRTVHMRYACNTRLRNALYHWARTSLQTDPAARRYYDHLRARGHHHARALRSVADRWLRILTAMLRRRTLYEPTRFAVDAA
jgi:transposase